MRITGYIIFGLLYSCSALFGQDCSNLEGINIVDINLNECGEDLNFSLELDLANGPQGE